MNITIEKKRSESNIIPNKGWSREDLLRKSSGITGKQLADYYSHNPGSGNNVMDLTMEIQNPQLYISQQKKFASSSSASSSAANLSMSPIHNLNANISLSSNSNVLSPTTNSTKQHQAFDFRSIRTDASLVPPIRQTASIFKQPVTIVRTQEGKVKSDVKHGTQDKPKQLFWEKRLENFKACDSDGTEFSNIDLPRVLKPVGPQVKEQTLFQSVATALHASNHPITGQNSSKTGLSTNPGVYINPEQPLMYQLHVSEDDIKKQQDRVELARKRLQEALKA